MALAYPRQPSNPQNFQFAMPMGDMTNIYYGPPGVPMQYVDSRRPNDRRISQQYANGNTLYDPYEGSNLNFRTTGHQGNKRYNQNGMQNTNGRQRKLSHPDSRPYHGQYTNVRTPAGGRHTSGPKPLTEFDFAVTQDQEFGCYFDWIGPQNATVNELYVKDLPEDIRETELEVLFLERLGVRPTSVNLRSSPQLSQQLQARKHAFVG